MKKILILLLISISIYGETIENLFPRIEKVQGVRPWWIEEVNPVEGMIGGIGSAPLNLNNAREIAMESARREIVASKRTYIESEMRLQQDSRGEASAEVASRQVVTGEVTAILIDTWEDNNSLYVWMAELIDRQSYERLRAYINQKNIETIENRINLVRYLDRIAVTNKESGMITLNAGLDKDLRTGEILNIYRLRDESVNPLSGEVEDFTRKKIGEVIVIDVFERTSRAQASFIDSFRIQIGDVAYPTGVMADERVAERQIAREEKMVKYDFAYDYIPKISKVERVETLSNRQYSLRLYSDFTTANISTRIGFFRFFESGLKFAYEKDNSSLEFIGKVGFPINADTSIGLGYESNLLDDGDYVIAMIEHIIANGLGLATFNYKHPMGSNSEVGYLGGAFQLQPTKSVLLGTELGRVMESSGDNELTVRINLEVMDHLWFGAGISWQDERIYFIKFEYLNII